MILRFIVNSLLAVEYVGYCHHKSSVNNLGGVASLSISLASSARVTAATLALNVAGLFTRWLVRGVKWVVQRVGAQVSLKKTLFAFVHEFNNAMFWDTRN